MPHFTNFGMPFGLFGQLNWWRNTKLTWASRKAYEEIEEELLLLDWEPRYIITILFYQTWVFFCESYQTWVDLLLSPFYFIFLTLTHVHLPRSFCHLELRLLVFSFIALLIEYVILPGICHLLNQLLLALSPYVVRWKAWVCICSVGGEHKMFGEFNLNDRW
jgi:hypothetical protein